VSTLELPRAVLFDWDSTLVDNWAGITSAVNAALTAFDHAPWSEAEVRARAKKSARDTFPELFGENADAALEIFYRTFAVDHVEKLRALPGAADLLVALGDAGVPMGVVSNKAGDFLRAEAAKLGWTDLFVKIIGATDAPRDKPAPDPIFLVLAAAGIPAGDDVWYVGDSVVDMECAHASGCRAVLVRTSVVDEAALRAWPPHHDFSDCLEIKAAIFD
jgi:phosphoglycolate phosphatase